MRLHRARHEEVLGGIGMPGAPGGWCLLVDRSATWVLLPVARCAQARPARDQRRQRRVTGEVSADGRDVGAEVEHAPHARDDGRQAFTDGTRIVTATALRSGR